MKKPPKHRTTIYTIVRMSTYPNMSPTTVLDSFETFESAEDAAGAYAQQMLERNIAGLSFNVFPSTYYAT
jgi:hypothetical protein